jgi:hypothetical protein
MMIGSRPLRADRRRCPPTALRVAAAAVALTATFAVAWAGSAASASDLGTHPPHHARPRPSASVTYPSGAAASAGTRVKFYIVQPLYKGHQEFLYEIAARTLGDGDRYRQIFQLNKGRLEPDGERLEKATEINAGWILELPSDASGPGVRFGPLPAAAPPAAPSPAAAVSLLPSPPAGRAAAASSSTAMPPRKVSAGAAIVAGILVALLVLVGLVTGLLRRRRRRSPAPAPEDSRPPVHPSQVPEDNSPAPPGQATGTSLPARPVVLADDDDLRWPDYLKSTSAHTRDAHVTGQ